MGKWELVPDDTIKEFTEYTKFLNISKEKRNLNVRIDYLPAEYESDETDQIEIEKNEIRLRSLNEDGTFNFYTLKYVNPTMMKVKMKSHNNKLYQYQARKL